MSWGANGSVSFVCISWILDWAFSVEVGGDTERLRAAVGGKSRWTCAPHHKRGGAREGGAGAMPGRALIAAANLEAIAGAGNAHLREDFRRLLEDVLLVIGSRDVGQVQVTDSGLGGQGR